MSAAQQTAHLCTPINIIEHPNPPQTSFLLIFLRSAEEALNNRGKIFRDSSISPLWYSAETERNVCLWKNGHSIADAELYEFWIDPWQLAKKRLKLSTKTDYDPLLSLLWQGGNTSPELTVLESHYVDRLLGELEKLCPHLHGLSCAAVEVEKGGRNVLLPKT